MSFDGIKFSLVFSKTNSNLYALYIETYFSIPSNYFSAGLWAFHYNNKLLYFIINMFARDNYGLLVLVETMTALLSSTVVLVPSTSTYETNYLISY